jgi:hypothetical protein
MKMSALEPAYEAARTWAVQPISHPPSGWAHIVRHGMASWMLQIPAEMEAPKPRPEPARLDGSPLLTLMAAMIAEVAQ